MQCNLAAFHHLRFAFPIFLAAGLDFYLMVSAGERNLRGPVANESSIYIDLRSGCFRRQNQNADISRGQGGGKGASIRNFSWKLIGGFLRDVSSAAGRGDTARAVRFFWCLEK